MGGKGGGDASNQGVIEAMISAQEAQQQYQLGEQELQWTQQVWQQEQPLVDASTKQQMALATQEQQALQQASDETQQQWQQYEDLYAPLEGTFVGQAENWASPANTALVSGEAESAVGAQGMQGLHAAAQTLEGYGVNPSSPRYASLFTSEQPMIGAAQAAAGTTAAQNLKLQQLGLESEAINTGRGLVNATGSLTQAGTGAASAGTGAASGAASTSQSNLSTGSTANTQSTEFTNAGTNAMNTYVNAIDSYNQAQLGYTQAAASEASGLGSAAGGIFGSIMSKIPVLSAIAQGGPAIPPAGIAFDMGGPNDPTFTPPQGGGQTGIPPTPSPLPNVTPGGTVPPQASPTMGQASDDVPAMLTANEFVMPKDVVEWYGQKYFYDQIDKARSQQQNASGREDIGGRPTAAIPQRPTFVSRPNAA
jgi:hypothetical protein